MNNRIRFSGLASGMDTESIVKQLMKAKRMRVDNFVKDKTKMEWKRDAYHDVNKNLATFIMDQRKKLGLTDYTYMGKLNPRSIDKVNWAKKVTTTDSNVFTATASGKAQDGELSLKVAQLAKSASVRSTVSEIGYDDRLEEDVNMSINVNGEDKTFTIKKGTKYGVAVERIAKETGLSVSFGKVGQVNTPAGMHDAYMFSMSTKETGADKNIKFNDAATLGFFKKFGIGNDEFKGQNSEIYINGGSQKIENTSNEFDVNGMRVSLKGVSETVGKDSHGDPILKEVKAKVTTDNDAIFDKIKEFVDGYNKVVGDLQDKLKEKSYRSYQPLTAEEKEALKDSDIKLLEEKAKSGLFRSDSAISKMLGDVREGLYRTVEGAHAIHEIGIETGKYTEGAKLFIDEDKLRAAIAEDPKKVLDTLFKSPDDISDYTIKSGDSAEEIARKRAGAKAQRDNTGVFVRIMDDMASGMKDIVKEAGAGNESNLLKSVRGNIMAGVVSGQSNLEYNITKMQGRIDEENRRLNDYENSLWNKFAAMEKAIQQMRDQSGWIGQQMGMGA